MKNSFKNITVGSIICALVLAFLAVVGIICGEVGFMALLFGASFLIFAWVIGDLARDIHNERKRSREWKEFYKRLGEK